MRKLIVVVLAIGLALGGILMFRSKEVALDHAPPQALVNASRQYAEPGAAVVGSAAGRIKVTDGVRQQIAVRELLQGDTRRIALSVDELDWLRRHAYPSDHELASLETLDMQALRGNKDPLLSTLQGLALLQQGNAGAGAAMLLGAGAMGAVYAYEEGAIADHALMQQRLGKTVDLDDVLRARLEVARILGDHRVEGLIAKHLPGYPLSERAEFVQQHTAEFLRQLGQEARLAGVSISGPDPRPNLDQWKALQKRDSSGKPNMIDVYRLE